MNFEAKVIEESGKSTRVRKGNREMVIAQSGKEKPHLKNSKTCARRICSEVIPLPHLSKGE